MSSRHAASRRAVLKAVLGGGVLAAGTGAGRAAAHQTSWLADFFAAGLPDRAETVARFGARSPSWFGLDGPGVVSSFPSVDEVALTFDACGGSELGYDADLVEVLRHHRAPATLFVNRAWAVHNWRTCSELVADPLFEVASHGDRHVPLTVDGRAAYGIPGTASVGEAYDEVARPQQLFRRFWGLEPRWFRPGTAHVDDVSVELAAHLGTPVVGFSVNADLGATADARQVAGNLLTLGPGGIALAHMNRPGSGTAAGTHLAVPALRERGLRLVRLGDVL